MPLLPFIGFALISLIRLTAVILLITRSENDRPSTEKVISEVRRTPSFSGPLMLPNRASANSLSAPIKSSGGEQLVQYILGSSFHQCYATLAPAIIYWLRKLCIFSSYRVSGFFGR